MQDNVCERDVSMLRIVCMRRKWTRHEELFVV